FRCCAVVNRSAGSIRVVYALSSAKLISNKVLAPHPAAFIPLDKGRSRSGRTRRRAAQCVRKSDVGGTTMRMRRTSGLLTAILVGLSSAAAPPAAAQSQFVEFYYMKVAPGQDDASLQVEQKMWKRSH